LAGVGPASAADANAELHALLTRQIALSVAVNEQQLRLDGCLEDPNLTSPEIAALREQIARLQHELTATGTNAPPDLRRAEIRREVTDTQKLLRSKIEALPEVRARIERIAADRRALQEADQRIRELRAGSLK
jgi:predicted  nucleic acid-binding Zn-ribbon protein